MNRSLILLFALLCVVVVFTAPTRAQVEPFEILPPENLTTTTPAPVESGNPPSEVPTSAPQVPEPSPVLVPSAAPISAVPTLLEDHDCIGNAPDPAFTCNGGRWTYIGDVTIGPGQKFTALEITGPTYILGSVNVTKYTALRIIPPFRNSTLASTSPSAWNLKTNSLLTVSECFASSSFPPSLFIYLTDYYVLPLSSASSYTFWGIDTSCDSTTLSTRWNLQFNDAQAVLTDGVCYTFIDQYRSFPSETDPSRWVSRIRLQWRDLCTTPSPYGPPAKKKGPQAGLIVGILIATLIGGAAAVWLGFCVWGCVCGCINGFGSGNGGGGGSDYSSNNNDNYGTFDSGGGGGGGGGDSGGGGGGWTSSSAGNWD